ncbi:ribbon-helix-helix protein, CopG family [Ornithinimicrobium sp. F0845]|uniref:ribbon-helix-helix protein, CopG family n=1 Tax=Ornithinimicrobium sp. F0845 TaxID=2926412 RepID=UPI001FF3F25D|nr:ribbon-helix-helix protein, CopG family [Ornithinimicrobium sp. F0845]MCK0112796.1 ribbon-helix-helix protein, CopG family [Ornithinimicrobium sp. F0845]
MAMTLRLSDDEDKALTEQAAREHRSKHEVARSAILEYTSRRSRRRDDLLTKIKSENEGALKRLADS